MNDFLKNTQVYVDSCALPYSKAFPKEYELLSEKHWRGGWVFKNLTYSLVGHAKYIRQLTKLWR